MDLVNAQFLFEGKKMEIIDTCGLRKPSRVREPITFYSTVRAMRVIESADTVILLFDTTQGVVEQDRRIASLVMAMAKGLVIAPNKIDLIEEDEYDKKNSQFTQLPQIDDRFIQKVSGASNIPVTRLLGISPAGQNATGESDMLNYYDEVQSIQENDFRPLIDWMDSIIIKSEALNLEKVEYQFLPLKQLTELEKADVDLKNAQRDQVYLDNNIVKETDVMSQLAENGTYVSIDENRVEEEKKEAESAEKQDSALRQAQTEGQSPTADK